MRSATTSSRITPVLVEPTLPRPQNPQSNFVINDMISRASNHIKRGELLSNVNRSAIV